MPFYWPLKRRFYLLKFRKRAFDKEIPWNWERINYNRIAVVVALLKKFSQPRYLEIGCASDILFNLVDATSKVGVDPLSGGTHRVISDDFFKTNVNKFNVIFIDGLHTYQQVRQDLINSLRVVEDGGFIALHDTLPRNWVEQNVPGLFPGAWTGDVWKVLFELLASQHFDFRIVQIDHGVTVIKVQHRDMVLLDLSETLSNKGFEYFYSNYSQLPLVNYQEFKSWINL